MWSRASSRCRSRVHAAASSPPASARAGGAGSWAPPARGEAVADPARRDGPLVVLHLDNHVLGVSKPAGLPSVPDASGDESLLDRAREWIRVETVSYTHLTLPTSDLV